MPFSWLKKWIKKAVPAWRFPVNVDFDGFHSPSSPASDDSIPSPSELAGSCPWRQSKGPLEAPEIQEPRPFGRCGFITAVDVESKKQPDILTKSPITADGQLENDCRIVAGDPDDPTAALMGKKLPAVSEASTGYIPETGNDEADPIGNDEFSLWGKQITTRTSATGKRISINRQTN